MSQATSIQGIFEGSSENPCLFNQTLDQWNLSKVVDFGSVFSHCLDFDQDISMWDVSNCESFREMFL